MWLPSNAAMFAEGSHFDGLSSLNGSFQHRPGSWDVPQAALIYISVRCCRWFFAKSKNTFRLLYMTSQGREVFLGVASGWNTVNGDRGSAPTLLHFRFSSLVMVGIDWFCMACCAHSASRRRLRLMFPPFLRVRVGVAMLIRERNFNTVQVTVFSWLVFLELASGGARSDFEWYRSRIQDTIYASLRYMQGVELSGCATVVETGSRDS